MVHNFYFTEQEKPTEGSPRHNARICLLWRRRVLTEIDAQKNGVYACV